MELAPSTPSTAGPSNSFNGSLPSITQSYQAELCEEEKGRPIREVIQERRDSFFTHQNHRDPGEYMHELRHQEALGSPSLDGYSVRKREKHPSSPKSVVHVTRV